MQFRNYRRSNQWFTLLLLALSFQQTHSNGAEVWMECLSTMPLTSNVEALNRTNCVATMLDAFKSNDIVKALIFLPGATDEFYMFRRATAQLTNTSPSLLDAVTALTNQTLIRATYRAPFLLLHTNEDPLEPEVKVENQNLEKRLRAARFVPHALYDDRDWNFIQPIL